MRQKLKGYAQSLRTNATKEENHLWYDFLKDHPAKFRRQVPFGRYILDFYCAEKRLAVELDGSQHYMDAGPENDENRTKTLSADYGIRVIRFSNLDVKNYFEGVCLKIDEALQRGSPSSAPCGGTFPLGGGRLEPGTSAPSAENIPITHQENTNMKTVTIYTDGACSGNPGPGGWGAILMYGPHTKELSGGEAQTTNNRMELTGVISALALLKEPCRVELYSDSKYVIDGLGKGWAKGWRARGWVKSDKKPALNPDLWGRLLDLCEQHDVHLHWVKGHAENQYNNRCDQLAVAQSQKYK